MKEIHREEKKDAYLRLSEGETVTSDVTSRMQERLGRVADD